MEFFFFIDSRTYIVAVVSPQRRNTLPEPWHRDICRVPQQQAAAHGAGPSLPSPRTGAVPPTSPETYVS